MPLAFFPSLNSVLHQALGCSVVCCLWLFPHPIWTVNSLRTRSCLYVSIIHTVPSGVSWTWNLLHKCLIDRKTLNWAEPVAAPGCFGKIGTTSLISKRAALGLYAGSSMLYELLVSPDLCPHHQNSPYYAVLSS